MNLYNCVFNDFYINSKVISEDLKSSYPETDVEILRSKALDLINESQIRKSLRIALRLSDPLFVSHLASVFQRQPNKLVQEVIKGRDGQNVIIELINQLMIDGISDKNKRWKIPMIGAMSVRIDTKNRATKSRVSALADQWSRVLYNASKVDGQHSESAKLLSISFKHFSI